MAMRPLSLRGPLSRNVGISMCGPWGPQVDIGFLGGRKGRIRAFSLENRRTNWEELGSPGVTGLKGILFSLGMACRPKHHYSKNVEG